MFNFDRVVRVFNSEKLFSSYGPGAYTQTQSSDYYPFGMAHTVEISSVKNGKAMEAVRVDPRETDDSKTFTRSNAYLYNGKEEQPMPGKWLDYGARFYDPQLGRWHSVDPLAMKYATLTPYIYVGNRPLIFIDPDGKEGELATQFVTPGGRTIIDTDDGRDDVVVVPWHRVAEFTANAQASRRTGHTNSTAWNDYWRDEFGIAISESFLNQFHSQAARRAYVNFVFSGSYRDWLSFLLSELGGQWTDPELLVQGLTMGVNGLHFNSKIIITNSNSNTLLLSTARENLLSRVQNPKLRQIINDLFRPTAKLGSGSAMDAYRLEGSHLTKITEYQKPLMKLWQNRDQLSEVDKEIVSRLVTDIKNAINGN